MKIVILFGVERHDIEVDESQTLGDLIAEVELFTGVPKESQKLIHKGTSFSFAKDAHVFLAATKLKNGSKIKLLGRKVDDATDELMRTLNIEDNATDEVAETLKQTRDELKQVQKGHLPLVLDESCDKLDKQVLKSTLDLEQGLARLDDLQKLNPAQRELRKKSIFKIQEVLDAADALTEAIANVRTNHNGDNDGDLID
eukprot:m.98308 g.98308  ORF g.98308 m.98308 type:complete len:199 (+) comp27049_c0_seq1:66-662(+)